MRVTRRGVFETNSSSTHSITIIKGDFIPDRMPLDDGVCAVYPGEFGWEEVTYQDAATKASYALTYARGSEMLLDMLQQVLQQETGVEVEFRDTGYGYIDHQSSGVCRDAFESLETLRAFIFNPASVLQTDNDNH